MKSNNVEMNLSNLDKWLVEVRYLMMSFSSIINDLEFTLFEISATYTKFRAKGKIVVFQYDINRYGGRTLDDIFIEESQTQILRLSYLIYEKGNKKRLHKIIADNSKENIPSMEVFEKLFREYLYDNILAGS